MSGPVGARVAPAAELDAGTRADVLALAGAASRADGATSLSEDAVLRLERTGPAVLHLPARDDGGTLVGYAQLAAAGDGFEGELLVGPAHRRRGHGTALLAATEALAAGRGVRLWSHGDTPGAAALAGRRGWARVRELLRLERRAEGLLDLPVPDLPADVRVRPLVPGADDAAWTALNAAAFAAHPEQGRWTVADLRARYAEDWFDPSLLLLAEAAGQLVGFCWMKVEDGAGELYVLGVGPSRAGAGLGRALLVRGLRAVAAALGPSATVDLYVDGDNVPAVRLYTRLGFGRAAVDVQYASPAAPPPASSPA